MNSEQLQYFELAYQERNFSAAARRVPCSPQGLAKAIHALEKELSVTLFESDPATGLPQPTDYAHELYEYAVVNDSNLMRLQEEFDRIRGTQHYTIKLGMSLGVLGLLGSEFLSGFKQLNPDVELIYAEASDRLALRGLMEGDYDLALVVGPTDKADKKITAHELYRAPIYVWVSSQDPLIVDDPNRTSIAIKDFADRNVAIPGKGFACYEQLLDDTRRAGVQLGQIYEMSEIFQLYEFALKGRGLGFSVRHLVGLEVFSNEVRIRALQVNCTPWHFGVTRLETHAPNDAESRLWNWCVSYARRLPSDPLG